MAQNGTETDALLDLAGKGDEHARQRLLERHRSRLLRMVAVRMDRRVAARLDPSDVVQEALADAVRELPDYLQRRPMAFYPWLRQFAWERLLLAASPSHRGPTAQCRPRAIAAPGTAR